MKPHRPVLGCLLALNTAVWWGLLPIIMRQTLVVMDPVTVVWYRFAFAAAGLGAMLAWQCRLPRPATFTRRQVTLLLLATAGLAVNFVLFNSALQLASPAALQILGQLGPGCTARR
jgi:drug/metabolite transporter (DMT)-like permease